MFTPCKQLCKAALLGKYNALCLPVIKYNIPARFRSVSSA